MPEVTQFARFVVRDNSGLLLGKSVGNLLKPGRVYQIVEILDELMIQDIGPSAINEPSSVAGCNWNHAAENIIENGSHLYTKEEFKIFGERRSRP